MVTKNKLATRDVEEKLWEGSELREEITGLAEMKRRILAKDDTSIPDELNDVKNLFLLRKNEKGDDLLREATIIHNLLAESLSQYKIRYKYDILDTYSDSNSDIIKQELKFI